MKEKHGPQNGANPRNKPGTPTAASIPEQANQTDQTQQAGRAEKHHLNRRGALSRLSQLSLLAAVPVGAAAGRIGVGRSVPFQSDALRTEPGETPLYQMGAAGRSRQFTTFDPVKKIKAYPIQPGEKRVLVDHNEPGIITRLWVTFNGWFWAYWEKGHTVDPTILKKFILRIYWDGQPFPSVEAPMGDFFGMGQCEYKPFLSRYLGLSSGGFYSYFPMPFEKIRIEVENLHDKVVPSIFLNANYQALDALPEGAGRFHCLYNAGSHSGEQPITILKAKGRGHYAGCCLSIQGKEHNYLSYLEAPEYFYIDTADRSRPTMVGTGLEDYFNGGWYFREGEFTGPFHGVPLKDALRSMVSMYRFHDQDRIGFNESIEMQFINPRPAEQLKQHPYKFSSTAYWYQSEAAKLAFPLPDSDKLVDWYRMRDTDHASQP